MSRGLIAESVAMGRRRLFLARDLYRCATLYRADRGITLGTTPLASGTTPPAVTISGALSQSLGLQIQIDTLGALGTATFKWSEDNGSTFRATLVPTAASVNILTSGGTIAVAFPAGTYAVDNVYKATVATWLDYSGAGNTATGAAGKQPLMIASSVATGRPAVRFASGQVMTHSLTLGNASTVYAVAKTTQAAAAYATIAAFGGSGAGLFLFARSSVNTWGFYMNGDANSTAALTSFKRIVGRVTSATNIDMRTNGATENITTGVSLYASAISSLGASDVLGTGQNLTGDIAELAAFNRLLSVPECQELESNGLQHWRV